MRSRLTNSRWFSGLGQVASFWRREP